MTDVRIAYRRDTPNPWKGSIGPDDIAIPSSLTLENANYIPIIGMTGQELRERRLSLTVRCSPEVIKYPLYDGRFRVGGFFSTSTGAAEIGSYGTNANIGFRLTTQGYVQRQLLADFRPGIYRIPPATDIKVELCISRLIAGGINFGDLFFSAEVIDSTDGPVSRPMQSIVATVPASANFKLLVNPYARWLDMHAVGGSIGVAASPILTAYGDLSASPTSYVPTLYRNYNAGTWFPTGEPIELGGSANNDMDSTPCAVYTIANSGTDSVPVLVTQFLEW